MQANYVVCSLWHFATLNCWNFAFKLSQLREYSPVAVSFCILKGYRSTNTPLFRNKVTNKSSSDKAVCLSNNVQWNWILVCRWTANGEIQNDEKLSNLRPILPFLAIKKLKVFRTDQNKLEKKLRFTKTSDIHIKLTHWGKKIEDFRKYAKLNH